jgi:hypothetical protein
MRGRTLEDQPLFVRLSHPVPVLPATERLAIRGYYLSPAVGRFEVDQFERSSKTDENPI